ncbi:TetR/AcrR family transcriptional regulator [Amycolatopsis sp. NPDC102389]|uniref:TetR/AcrR family transcriptional regulator n=1 Tax=Amycolatopsis sp. NPDC102389 TaxID=3363941 RepID=UPI003813FAFC
MSTTEPVKRADARRNVEAILDAATASLAVDPGVSIDKIAKAAGVGRVTLYGHFASRAVLVAEVAARAIARTDEALDGLDLDGEPREAMARLVEATWELTRRFGAIVMAASEILTPAEMHRMHAGLAERVRELVERGQESGTFRKDIPATWHLMTFQAVLHGASAAVHRGEVTAGEAPRLVRETVLATLAVR